MPPPPVSIRQARVRGPELVHDLRLLRRLVADHAADCGLEFARQRDLVLATDEIVVNAVRHGGGDAVLKLWRDGDRAVAEVSDQGLLDDAMAGRREPDHLREGGRGLWIVNQLCDLVQIRSTPEGTVVRLFVGP